MTLTTTYKIEIEFEEKNEEKAEHIIKGFRNVVRSYNMQAIKFNCVKVITDYRIGDV